jgi:hypothetical protein
MLPVSSEKQIIIIIIIIIIMALQPLLGLGRLILYTVGRTAWTGDQAVARPIPTHRTTETRNKRTQTSMPRMGFEPTIPEFEGAKAVHALDRTACDRLWESHVINKYYTKRRNSVAYYSTLK